MKNRVFISIICFAIIITSCFPLVMDLRYGFDFYNNSDEDVYVIIDMEPQDGIINVGSVVDWCGANSSRNIGNKKPWYEVVKDSMYLYIIDASKIDLPIDYLSHESAERITQDMILSRKTVHHYELYDNYFSVSYPYKKTY